jgi:membrane protein DedA with SNARE-associated domain
VISALEHYVIPFLKDLYGLVGYWGVFFAMAIESACIPLPSEFILPMAGIMVAQEGWDLWIATLAGTLGCTLGSAVAYWVGAWGGRPILNRYGKYIFISQHDLDLADSWFAKYGDAAIFFSRLLPVVRTFISFPAGVARMHFVKFLIYTTLGSFPWSLGLVYVGVLGGQYQRQVLDFLHKIEYLVILVVVALVALYIYRHVRHSKPAV